MGGLALTGVISVLPNLAEALQHFAAGRLVESRDSLFYPAEWRGCVGVDL